MSCDCGDGEHEASRRFLVAGNWKCVRHWIVLDELNLAPSDVLEALNRLLDDNRELFVPELQETVRRYVFSLARFVGFFWCGGKEGLSALLTGAAT